MRVTTNIGDVARNVSNDIEEQNKRIIRAGKAGLTDTMYDIKRGLNTEMKKSFNRPTQFTLRSPMYFRPKSRYNQSESHIIWISDDRTNPGQTPADHYLVPQIEGGYRKKKPFERKLTLYGVLKSNEYTVPVSQPSGVRYNSYGNMSQGQIIQILTAFARGGFQGGMTGRGRGRLEFKRMKRPFPGIYVRKYVPKNTRRARSARAGTGGRTQANRVRARSNSKINKWKPVLAIIDRPPVYHKRYSFYEYVNKKYHDNIDRNVRRRINRLVR